ncbi:hypothetical protein QN277_014032 [Acacia crassicarpa]|uniref:Late embryogenesis abundant protein LEA-2 subgroup domain-containing protein n=1 Tax=Acacia crassicarpa TaxID=499986 RepID=A0AAE1N4M4_9FABA|nr:hypothetical protein QN277_014032 [Acacia crassicarpa]
MAHKTPFSTALRCLIIVLMVMMLLIGVLAIIYQLVLFLLPRPPKLQVVSLNTSPIIFTPYFCNNQPSTLMSATWNLTFIAKNPNKKMQLHYTDVKVAVYYQRLLLSSQKLTFFKQSKKSEVEVQVSVANPVVLSNQSAAAMVKDGLEDLSINLIVRFEATVMVYADTFIIGRHDLSIDCDDVKVVFSPQNGTGSMLDPTRKCYSNNLIF